MASKFFDLTADANAEIGAIIQRRRQLFCGRSGHGTWIGGYPRGRGEAAKALPQGAPKVADGRMAAKNPCFAGLLARG